MVSMHLRGYAFREHDVLVNDKMSPDADIACSLYLKTWLNWIEISTGRKALASMQHACVWQGDKKSLHCFPRYIQRADT